ncbi:MAG: hypothetical protein P1P84_22150 [Deferrisomatales bacterium]|nr:hypothetical protein [Deferrisomatales bacterium]
MRNAIARLTTAALAALFTVPAALAHPGIELRTYPAGATPGAPIRTTLVAGRTLAANGNAAGLVAGAALSPRQTCDGCHDYQAITAAYHFQLGADERVDADGNGFADDLGEVLTEEGGLLETLPTLRNISSPGQFGAW